MLLFVTLPAQLNKVKTGKLSLTLLNSDHNLCFPKLAFGLISPWCVSVSTCWSLGTISSFIRKLE